MNRAAHTLSAFAAAMFSVVAGAATSAEGKVIEVGLTHALHAPSEAAVVAQPGDTIRIDPGTYQDCAVWRAPRLVIEAAGDGVVLTGKVCQQKGIFVIEGSDATVRGITFQGATNAEHNAAGIRLAGANLTVEHSRFLHNENGILAGGTASSTLRITGSTFIGNGACIGPCAHGVYAGQPIGLLEIEHCTFQATRSGHHIKSRALKTRIRFNRIEDGLDGTASYLIDVPNGGETLIEGNTMEKGPHSENRPTAISLGAEGVSNPTHSLVVTGNRFRNDTGGRTVFVRNHVPVQAELQDNRLDGDVEPLAGPAR